MYEEDLKALLGPLGVYRLDRESLSGAELYALGAGLDAVAARLDRVERESVTATAEEEGLRRREDLFLHRPVASSAQERRDAIAALLQIDGDSLTPGAINRAIRGCGLPARAVETGPNKVRVEFPGQAGGLAELAQAEEMILDLLPCHLEVEFQLQYLTWALCHKGGYTWEYVEGQGYTWRLFQLAVPPESGEG